MILDIETDGLLDAVTKVHCGVLRSLQDGTVTAFKPDQIASLIDRLDAEPYLVGHNLQGFDLPVLKKLYGYEYRGEVLDTLVTSRLVWPDLRDTDFGLAKKGKMPTNLIGRHSLEAWGYRLGYHKGEFAKTTDWKEFSQEMLDYCIRDTEVTARLYTHLCQQEVDKRAVALEHSFAACINNMMERGIRFDRAAAERLTAKLMGQRAEIDSVLVTKFPPFVDKYVTEKKKIERTKMVAFNPQSRAHIARALREKYQWKPTQFTETGEPQMDETVLSKLPYAEAPMLAARLELQKRLGQLAEGTQNWIQAVKADGRIHGFCNHNGAVTGRCTHSNPNMAQVPKDPEYRSLFIPADGMVLVGCDASGLELRCFGHYLAAFDGGEYAKEVVSGDIHTRNQQAAGLATRNQAKTFIYALLYGAGDAKIGEIVGGTAAEGKALRGRFMRAIPAYRSLTELLKVTMQKRKWLVGLDGRKLHIRHEHAALNTLLQSAGAIVMKQATASACRILGSKAHLVAHVHDEMQFECLSEHADEVGATAADQIRVAGTTLGFRCPLAGEWRKGISWAETH